MSRFTICKLEAAIAASVIIGYCAFSLLSSFLLVYIGTKSFVVTNVCNDALQNPTQNGYDSTTLNQTCDFFINYLGDTPVIFGYTFQPNEGHMGSIITLICCWLTLFATLALTIPQVSTSMDLFRATTISKSDQRSTEKALVWTWRHQSLQNIIIFVELLIALVITGITLLNKFGDEWEASLESASIILTKCLTGRVFCAFFVEIYFHEQLMTLFYSGHGHELDLPAPIRKQFDKEYKKLAPKEDEKPEKLFPV